MHPIVTLDTIQNSLLADCQLTIHFNIGHRCDATHKVGSRTLVWSSILPLNIGNREGVVTWDLHDEKQCVFYLRNSIILQFRQATFQLTVLFHNRTEVYTSIISMFKIQSFHGDWMKLIILRISVMLTQNKIPLCLRPVGLMQLLNASVFKTE
jgi:hypothetical protein